MAEDFHDKAFESSTLTKLGLFREYLKKWLPVFIRKNTFWPVINIFDLLCGPGKDKEGILGSPLIIIEELQPYIHTITDFGLRVRLFFNDLDTKKVEELKQNIQFSPFDISAFGIHYKEEDSKKVFYDYYSQMQSKDSASLFFFRSDWR